MSQEIRETVITPRGISMGVSERKNKEGKLNSYGVFAWVGNQREFYLLPEQVALFPQAGQEGQIKAFIQPNAKYGDKIVFDSFIDPAQRRERPAA